jgi:hypothetical protein
MMKKMTIGFTLIFLVILVSSLSAQEGAMIEVTEMVFCTGVDDRIPVGADTMFLNTVEQVYCFTKITGISDTMTVAHVWYYNDDEMARVDLAVRGDPWRTWSSKRIVESWGGKWRVDVVTPNGEILKSMDFMIQSTSQ